MKLDLRGNDWPVEELGPDAIENVSWQVRSAYIDLITRLGKDRKGDVDWWVSSLASRNTYTCPLYLRLCQLMLVKNLCDNGQLPTDVITDSSALAHLFKQFLGASVNIELTANSNKASRLTGFARRYAAAFYHAASQYLGSLLWIDRTELPVDEIILVDIFLSPANLSGTKIEDRYYSGMMEALDEVDRKKFFYTPIHYKVKNYYRYFKDLNNCRAQVLLKEDVLKLNDYVYALMHPFRFRWPDKSVEFMGLDVGSVVREALNETFSNSSSIEGLLRYRFARRLKISGFKPGKIIEWFENQEVDHGAIAGWREFYPDVEIIGYQGFLASPHYLSYLPTEQERQYSLLPTRVVVIGKNLIDRAKEFAPHLNVVTGPAFRFSTVWNEMQDSSDKAAFSILVALPIHYLESRNIISVISEAVEEYRHSKPVNVFIKPHPTWKHADVSRLLRGKKIKFELLNSSFDDALAASDLVISSASSVCVYAIARGVPCLIVGNPGMLLQNPIPRDVDERLWKSCYSSQEMSREIEYYSALGPEEKDDLHLASRNFRALQFTPVTRELVYDFIDHGT